MTSIAIGGIIYTLWREQNLLMFEWFKIIGVLCTIDNIRNITSIYYSIIPKWVCYSLPNALWLFGGIFLLISIWKHSCFEQYIWIGVFIIIAIGSEIGQLVGVIPGTWDFFDMLLMIVSILLAISLNRKKVRNEKIYKHLISYYYLAFLAVGSSDSEDISKTKTKLKDANIHENTNTKYKVRVAVNDNTKANPVHGKAEIWFRGQMVHGGSKMSLNMERLSII